MGEGCARRFLVRHNKIAPNQEGECMRVFVAGATGAIGQPLIAELVRQGHTVTGMTHSEAGARKLLRWERLSPR